MMEPTRFLEMETGALYCDDNRDRLASFPTEEVDLVYLDPPFFSNRYYEVIWGDEAEIRSFDDRWEKGLDYYIDWMEKRVVELHRVLKQTGALYLHCDPHASHYLKVMLDKVFGSRARFLSEIVWKRTSAHSSAQRYGPVHDVILFYSKSDTYTWHPTYQDYDVHYLDQFYTHRDPDGRRWRRSDLTGAGVRRGETGQPWHGIDVTAKGRHWAHPPSVLDRLDAEGHIHWPKKPGGMPMFKRYADEQPGVPLQDVWTDIPPMHNLSRERIGYPTQKPEMLLERIIASSSDPGDVVLDPFCGCGTTVAVAQRMRREWIGIDISRTAIEVIKRRIRLQTKGRVTPKVRNVSYSEGELRKLKPFEFQNWVLWELDADHSPRKTGDMGIDGLSYFYREPIQIKRSDRVDRNVVDNFETAVERSGNTRGYIVAFSFTPGCYREARRAREKRGLDIVLVTVADILYASEALTRPTQESLSVPSAARDREERTRRPPTPELLRLFGATERRETPEYRLLKGPPQDVKPTVERLHESENAPVG